MPFEFVGLASATGEPSSVTRSEKAAMHLAVIGGLLLGITLVEGWPGWLLSASLAYGLCVAVSAVICRRHSRYA